MAAIVTAFSTDANGSGGDAETSTSYTDVGSGATLVGATSPSADNHLEAGETYWIFATAMLWGSSSSESNFLRLVHGATPTVIGTSEMIIEPQAQGDAAWSFTWMGEMSLANAETLKFQHRADSSNTTNTAYTTFRAFKTSEFTAGDYAFDTETSVPSLSNGWSTGTQPTVTITGGSADWLVIGCAQFTGTAHANASHQIRLNDGTNTTPDTLMEPEDVTNDKQHHGVMRVYSAVSGSTTYDMNYGKGGASGSATLGHGSIVAIKLDAFEDHAFTYTDGAITITDNDDPRYGTEVAATTDTATSTGAFWTLGYLSNLGLGGAYQAVDARIHLDGATEIGGHRMSPRWASDDILPCWMHGEKDYTATNSVDCDMDASSRNAGSPQVEHRCVMIASVESAGGAPAVPDINHDASFDTTHFHSKGTLPY